MSVHFSSKSDEWATPQDFFNKVVAEFGAFDLDPCCTAESAKAPRFFTKDTDGLNRHWSGNVWMNPPYGRTIGLWMKKAYEASLNGCVCVCLVPARTDTAWWHNYAMRGEVRFIRGRLKLGGHKNSAPFPSALVIFNQPNASCTSGTP